MAKRYNTEDVFRIMPETFDEIDSWIKAAQSTGRSIGYGMNALAMLMAYTNQAFAKQMSAGPVDPRMQNPGAAWKVPVRRITSKYYTGWKVSRMAPGVWMLYNDSREAYYIEFGIHPTGSLRATEKGYTYVMRVRRPIRKLSLKKTLSYVDATQAGARIWETSFAPFRENYTYRGNPGDLISLDQVQSMTGMKFI
jgi:hypothetical protein